jgi:RNA polymerase sigma factor (sigma-70 family)
VDENRTAWFEALYATTFHHIVGYAVRRCESADDAADVVAETFAVAWRRVDAIPAGDQARLWLYGVARNVLAEQRRGAVRRREVAASLAAEIANRHEPSAEDLANDDRIGRAFRRLPHDDRELLTLVAWEGLDNGQIATVLGCSRNAVRIRLHRARKRLAQHLETAGVETRRPAPTRSSL